MTKNSVTIKRKAIVKIDLCDSKRFLGEKNGEKISNRTRMLKQLVDKVKEIFPSASAPYPEGSLYDTQGDCIYIVLEKPTVALRATIEFMKSWYSMIQSVPDCRAVIDFGDIAETNYIGRINLTGELFETINAIEKIYNNGEIGVTQNLKESADETLVQFINRRITKVTLKREIISWQVNYENPRIVDHSSLVHALFISPLSGDNVRNRSFEVIFIECIIEHKWDTVNYEQLVSWLEKRNIPYPGVPKVKTIVKSSNYLLQSPNEQAISIDPSKKELIINAQKNFYKYREEAIEYVSNKLGNDLGLDGSILRQRIKIDELIEEYLSAIFLEIRIMANYFRSTQTVFDKLSASSEYDFILKKYLNYIVGNNNESFVFSKKSFINTLLSLTKKKNIYLAAIFHNVLMLYYLNRNSRFAHSQLSDIRSKEIYIDTNAFYAIRFDSSVFHDMIYFSFKKLKELNVSINIFDKSIVEYNNSINSTLYNYKKHNGIIYLMRNYQKREVLNEFIKNTSKYNNDFEYCVALHRFPANSTAIESLDVSEVKKQLKEDYGINLCYLDPYLEKEDLGDLYDEVYRVKLKNDSTGHTDEFLHRKVIHDANCLRKIKCSGTNPYNFKKIFITCDHYLAKIRKINDKYNYILTVGEFYEFMLPYFFLSDVITKEPIEMPNFLLAAALTTAIDKTLDFDKLIGSFLQETANHDTIQNYRIFSEMESSRRFEKIKKDQEKITTGNITDNDIKEFARDLSSFVTEYQEKIRKETARQILSGQTLSDLYQNEVQKNRILEEKLKKFKEKEEKRKKFVKKQQIKSKK